MSASTKDLIADTIDVLARQNGAEKITVKAVIEKSGIARQTFYYYFQDIIDAVEYSVRRKTQELMRDNLTSGDLHAALYQLTSIVVQNRSQIKRLLQCSRLDRVEQILVKGIREYLLEMMRATDSDPALKYSEAETALSFYTYGVVGILMDSCRKPDLDAERLADRLYALLTGQSLLF